MEAKLLPEAGFAFAAIPARGWVGKGKMDQLRTLLMMPAGIWKSVQILRRFLPHLVIGIGGYAAGPVMLAAWCLRHKLLLLEPNAVPGLVNRLMAPHAHKVMIAFDATRACLKGGNLVCCGTPVRPEIVAARHAPRPRAAASPMQALETNTPVGPGGSQEVGVRSILPSAGAAGLPLTLLVLGGSQGAHALNRAMMDAAPFLDKARVAIIHQTGQKDEAAVREAYERIGCSAKVSAYIHDMAAAYGACDLVISRAGAGTLAEIAVVGLPSILIPYPFAQGHQEKNADALVSAGAAEMILERDLNGRMLAQRVTDLLSAPQRRTEMAEAASRLGHPHSAEEMVRIGYQVAGRAWRAEGVAA